MNPRLLSTPRLSVRERAMLLALLLFDSKRASSLVQRVSERSEELLLQLKELPKVELKILVVELRRMLDQRFEGLSLIHSSWFLSLLEKEPPTIHSLWLSELPFASSESTQRAPAYFLPLFRTLFMKGLVEMPPELKEKQWQRKHLPDLPEALLQKLLTFLQPQELGSALFDLGQELLQKLAQRLPKSQGELVLQGHQNPIPNAIFLLLRAAEKSGFLLEK